MSPDQIEQVKDVLKAQGLNPIEHENKTLGRTIRMAGEDVDRFSAMQPPNVKIAAIPKKNSG